MSRQITHRRMSGGSGLEHIVAVKYNENSYLTGSVATRQQMVDYIDQGNYAYVARSPYGETKVTTVHPSGRAAYIKTEPNSTGTDNLLALPTF